MDNTQVKIKREKVFKKQDVVSDRDALDIFNKCYTKFNFKPYKLTALELKTVGTWIKEQLAIKSLKESEIRQKMDEVFSTKINTVILMELCSENNISEVSKKLDDPNFIIDPKMLKQNKLVNDSLLFTGNKNHSKEILELVFSKTDLKIDSFDHTCLKNCGINAPDLAMISQFYKSYDEFSKALKVVALLRPEEYNDETMKMLLKKQYIFINL